MEQLRPRVLTLVRGGSDGSTPLRGPVSGSGEGVFLDPLSPTRAGRGEVGFGLYPCTPFFPHQTFLLLRFWLTCGGKTLKDLSTLRRRAKFAEWFAHSSRLRSGGVGELIHRRGGVPTGGSERAARSEEARVEPQRTGAREKSATSLGWKKESWTRRSLASTDAQKASGSAGRYEPERSPAETGSRGPPVGTAPRASPSGRQRQEIRRERVTPSGPSPEAWAESCATNREGGQGGRERDPIQAIHHDAEGTGCGPARRRNTQWYAGKQGIKICFALRLLITWEWEGEGFKTRDFSLSASGGPSVGGGSPGRPGALPC